MPHEFTPYEEEPEPQAAGAKGRGPRGGKPVATDLIEPSSPHPPVEPPLARTGTRAALRVAAIVILAGFGVALLLWVLGLIL